MKLYLDFKVKLEEGGAIARPRQLAEGLQAYDFHTLAKNEPHARPRIRLLGMAHFQAGWSTHDIAMSCVHETTVHSGGR